jgi:hypothetical protein
MNKEPDCFAQLALAIPVLLVYSSGAILSTGFIISLIQAGASRISCYSLLFFSLPGTFCIFLCHRQSLFIFQCCVMPV